MNSHNRLIAIIGLFLAMLTLVFSLLNISELKFLFYMQTLIVIAVCFHVIIGKPLWHEKMENTKLKSLFLAISIFIIFVITFFLSSLFRALVLGNIPLFIITLILLITLCILIFHKKRSNINIDP